MRIVIIFAGLFFITGLRAQNSKQPMDSVSYSFGVLIAQNLKSQGLDSLDQVQLAQGIQDVLKGAKLRYDVQQCNNIVQQHMMELESKKYAGNVEEGKKFLVENGKRPGVVTLPSGLQYEVLTAGSGPKPAASDRVTVHYTGTLVDGTVFDSSVDRGEPATFGVTQVIQGWVEGLQLMPLGSKWKFFIPYELGYGERGAGGVIGPFATLIFEVELLKIN
jgi:FKBP-type peptidyl-prolyl cis-trans isomerase FklB